MCIHFIFTPIQDLQSVFLMLLTRFLADLSQKMQGIFIRFSKTEKSYDESDYQKSYLIE